MKLRPDAQPFLSLTGTANVFKTVRLYADKTLPAVSGTVQVQKRTKARFIVEASVSYPARTARLAILQRIADRVLVEAEVKQFHPITSTLTLGTRKPIEAEKTFGASSSLAQVSARAPARREISPAATYGAPTYADVAVQKSSIQKVEITATLNLTAASASVSVSRMLPVRSLIEAATTFPVLSHTANLEQRIADRHRGRS